MKRGNSMSENSLPPGQALIQMAGAFNISQVIYVTARVSLVDLLKNGSKTTEELAEATGSSHSGLYRLLRALLALGILTQDSQGRFNVTDLGSYLQADHPASVRPYILFLAGEENWQSWGNFLYSIKTGESAFQHLFGMNLFEYAGHNREFGEIFNNGMASMTANMVEELIAAYDFSRFNHVVDVGGGNGALLAALLKVYPTLQGTVVDLPEVTGQATQLLAEAGVSGRSQAVGGDFFKSVPTGGDVYILKLILHDWDNQRASEILKNCRQAMAEKARLLVVEGLIPEKILPTAAHLNQVIFDLRMLTMTPGGRERTETEFGRLFEGAGLDLVRVISLPRWKILEGVKAR
jgi:hypothetical protein